MLDSSPTTGSGATVMTRDRYVLSLCLCTSTVYTTTTIIIIIIIIIIITIQYNVG